MNRPNFKQRLMISKDPFHTKIALFEEGKLVEYFQEPRQVEGLVGNIYVGRVNRIMPGMASAFITVGLDRDGFLFEGDMGPAAFLDGARIPKGAKRVVSLKHISEGQRLLVQVSKEPMGPKGARLTAQISLPGNYMIFMPFLKYLGVSRKIEGQERHRLKEAVRRIAGDFNGGFIVRTAAEGAGEEELASEMQNLAELWSLIKLRASVSEPPTLVHQEVDAVARSIREILIKGEGVVCTDDPEIGARCRDTLKGIGQDESRVEIWEDSKSCLFEQFGVEEELEKALRPRVWLPSGGCIVIQSTEALVAIDVNSGRFVGKRSLEETAFAINMEAAEEVVRQLRLRGLGGIIVIDFIDMQKKAHRDALIARLTEEMKRDRAKSRILAISEFGLVEMTRKRSHRNLDRVMTGVCSCCEGRGRIAAPWRVAKNVLRSLSSFRADGSVIVSAPLEVVRFLEEHRESLEISERVSFEAAPNHSPLGYEISSESDKNPPTLQRRRGSSD